MCGIAGIFRTWSAGEAPPEREAIPEAWLDVLDESIRQRGPDGCGRLRQRVVRDDGATVDVALVHRRLSIIDHAGGAQPMVVGGGAGGQAAGGTGAVVSREGGPYEPARPHRCPKCGPGTVAVVFNGCIYNHRELRRELEAAGHVFRSDHSDTEVLLHGWREWGEGLSARLDGMFALTVWDSDSGSLHLAIDRFGEKPLLWTTLSAGGQGEPLGDVERSEPLAFASSASALARLRAAAGLRCTISEGETWHWIEIGSRAGAATPVVEINPMDPDSWRTFGARAGRGGAWREFPARDRPLTADDVERLLARSVAERLEADVEVGCFLSGGVDSSLVAMLARRAAGRVRTFTVRMPAAGYDESAIAERVARAIGSEHVTLDCEDAPAEDLVRLVGELGLPFGDSSLLPTHWVSLATRAHSRVALSGDGGDELFAGYRRQMIAPHLARWWRLLRLVPPGLVPERLPGSRLALLRRLAGAARAGARGGGFKFGCAYGRLGAILGEGDRDWGFEEVPGWVLTGDAAEDALRIDLTEYLPGDILRKTDTASMSVALEVRAPFLGREVREAAMRAPIATLRPGGQRKGLLREVARRHLPAEIVDRPKMGFAIPIGEWFRSDYGGMRQLLRDHLGSAEPFPGLAEAGVEIDMGFVRRLLREHDAAGEKSINPWRGRDHSQRLYMLLVLSVWCRWLRGLGGR